MKIPPFHIGAVLIFWGIETGNLLIGVVLCLLFEGSSLVKIRYHLEEDDFVKISDLTSLIFIGSVALILLNHEPISFLRITTGWLPLILSPLMMAQLYCDEDQIIIGTRLGKKKKTYTHKPIDFRFYYIVICLFAAATGNSRSVWFFPALGLFLSWFLFYNRGRAYGPVFFISLIVACSALGYGGAVSMELGHKYVMRETFRFWHKYYRQKHGDPYKNHVNFGDTGRLKLSGEIVMRVDSFSSDPPRLIKEASYAIYRKGDWFGNQGNYQFLQTVKDGEWNLLNPPHPEGKKVRVEFDLPKEKGMVPILQGSYRVLSSTIFELEVNDEGAVKVVDGAPVISYDLFYHSEMPRGENLLRARHLDVPDRELYVLEKVAAGLAISDGSDVDKVVAVKKYFNKDFTYSLNLLGKGDHVTPLGNFLLNTRSGFCEYYATATALLLRNIGIPSRYAIGYAVEEKSILEGKYIVRERHAHAWAEAFVDGHWMVVDTTPSNWLDRDAERASLFESIRDLFSFASHKYQLFQIGSGEDYTLFFSILVVVLTAFLVFRIYRRLKIEQAQEVEYTDSLRHFDQIPSPFAPIITVLNQSGIPRRVYEPLGQWADRTAIWHDFDGHNFNQLYKLHLQLRFDPRGLGLDETDFLERGVKKYLDLKPT